MERRHEARVEGRVIRLSECDRSLNVVDHCHAHLYKYAHRIDQLFGTIGEADESQNNTREPYIRYKMSLVEDRQNFHTQFSIQLSFTDSYSQSQYIFQYISVTHVYTRYVGITSSDMKLVEF